MTEPKEKKPRDNSPEARRQRAEQRKLSAAATLRAIATEERKKRTQRLIALGAPVEMAGLSSWHEDTLLGAFLTLKSMESREDWPTREKNWREVGAQFRANRKAEREAKKTRGVPVAVEFPRPFDGKTEADKEARAALHKLGLQWVRQLGVWVGDVDLDAAYEIVTRYGGVLERKDGVPNGATTDVDPDAERVH